MRETPGCSSDSMWVRSCSATLACGAVVVGDLLSDATFFGGGGPGRAQRRSRMLQDAIIKYDDGRPRTKHLTTNCAIEVDEAAGTAEDLQ